MKVFKLSDRRLVCRSIVYCFGFCSEPPLRFDSAFSRSFSGSKLRSINASWQEAIIDHIDAHGFN